MPRDASEPTIMSLGDHLEDLRRRIIFGLIGVGVALIFMLFVGKPLVAVICQPLLYQLHAQGMQPSLEMPSVTSAFGVYIKVSLIGAVIIGLPWLLYQVWLFIAPGLYRHERRFVVMLLPGSAALSVAGIAFMYFIMLPITLWFFVTFASSFGLPDLSPSVVQQRISSITQSEDTDTSVAPPLAVTLQDIYTHDPPNPVDGQTWINSTENARKTFYKGQYLVEQFTPPILSSSGYHITEYISFVMWMALAFSLAFQLPMVMLLLGFTGIMRLETMIAGWKYMLLVVFVASMILTPADIISQFAMAIPMYILYLFGLVLVKLTTRRRREADDAT